MTATVEEDAQDLEVQSLTTNLVGETEVEIVTDPTEIVIERGTETETEIKEATETKETTDLANTRDQDLGAVVLHETVLQVQA